MPERPPTGQANKSFLNRNGSSPWSRWERWTTRTSINQCRQSLARMWVGLVCEHAASANDSGRAVTSGFRELDRHLGHTGCNCYSSCHPLFCRVSRTGPFQIHENAAAIFTLESVTKHQHGKRTSWVFVIRWPRIGSCRDQGRKWLVQDKS